IAVVVTAMAPFGGGIVGGALNAALGSVVSQAVGVATGIQEKFDWKGVALAAISGGVGGAVSSIAGPAQTAIGVAIRGAATNATTQAIAVTMGLQDKFSWAAVAAAGVGGGFSAAAGQAMSNAGINVKAFSSRIGINMASAIGDATARTLIEGTDFGDNIRASLPSAIGSAIGGYLAEGGGSGPGLLEAMTAGGVKPLEIKPIHDKIDVRSPQTELDPVTAALPPLVEQNEQNGPSNFGVSRRGWALDPELADSPFRMQAVGVEAALRRQDLATIDNIKDLSGGPIDITSQFEDFARQNPEASKILRLTHDPSSSGRVEDASWTLDLLVAGIGGLGGLAKAGVEGAVAKSPLWKLPWLDRGNKIEVEALKSVGGRNGLHANFPVIDSLTSSGRAISVVSIDLSAKTYLNNPKAISNALFAKLNKVANFAKVNEVAYSYRAVTPNMVKSRELLVAIPKGPITPAQQQALQAVYQHGLDRGVKVTIKKF
ncbi:hypothetical protein, partial [Candidatus Phycosocius spiralis]|uniref:endonuclease toxin domain-containing protein n=1 Tax=Candidatus Phycosocius spiralis TaxID=2815099 RepID=UPI0024E043F5